jgi:hypothetical protein
MRIVLNILGVLIVLLGGVWFLQGIGILAGSAMSGQVQWAINGSIAALIGVAMIVVANWPRKSAPPPGQ